MPNSNEGPSPPAGEAAPAPVSTPVDSVSEVNEQLEAVKLANHDEAPVEAETKPKEHPDLWKPHPPTEECPVCLVPLPLDNTRSMYWACCGKLICTACSEEHARAQRVTNRKRDVKKLPALELMCAFCRSPLHKNDPELMSRFEKRIEMGDTRAMVNVGKRFRDGSGGTRKDKAKAFELFHRAAGLGSAEAIGQLGCLAVSEGPSLTQKLRKGKEYFEDAAAKGDVESRKNLALAAVLAGEDKYDLAIKHWHLAAAAGYDRAMKGLWKCFSKGKLSKPDLEKALRAHKAACDEMNSEERERLAAYKEAMDGNDSLLKKIYASYYMGFINAKELKKLLKAHAAGDRGAVETLLNMKIPLDYK